MKTAWIAVCCLLLLGCQQAPQGKAFEHRLQNTVHKGMSREAVMDTLGVPQLMIPPGFTSEHEQWQYIVPGVSCLLIFDTGGKLLSSHYNRTASIGLGGGQAQQAAQCSPEVAAQIAQELRLLRMDNTLDRARLPYPLRTYLETEITPQNMFDSATAYTLVRQLTWVRQSPPYKEALAQ